MPYMCYVCNEAKADTSIQNSGQGLVCIDCDAGFIEELVENFAHDTIQISNVPQAGAVLPNGGVVRVGEGEFENLIQALFQHVFGIVGSLEDYALGADNLDDVVTQLMNQMDGSGPPPASSEELQRIQTATISSQQADQGLQCFVCFDEFAVKEQVERLPCDHHFHRDCIRPWLSKHGTCPVCRKTLAGEDTSTLQYSGNQQQQQQVQQQQQEQQQQQDTEDK